MTNILIITGASRGIGAATAKLFMQQGWQVFNLSRTEPKHTDIQHISADFLHLDHLAKQLDNFLPKIKNASKICLVHNAAKLVADSIQNMPPKSFEEVLTVNLMAPNLLNQKIIPFMKSGSSIIYIGSTASEMAFPHVASYVICKHAIVGMMRATCQDLQAEEIHTACICPGFTNTEMLQQYINGDQEKQKTLEQRNMGNRLIDPKEIAELVWFSANNPVINGASIAANLGQKQS